MYSFQHLEAVKQAKLEEEKLLTLLDRLEAEIIKLERENGNPSLLEKCLQEKLRLDHRLDELEELTSYSPYEIRKQLIALVEERKEGERTLQEIEQFEDLEKRLSLLAGEAALLNGHLTTLIENRERVRNRNVLSYIFGTNPNAAIQNGLREGTSLAKKIEEMIPSLLTHSSTRVVLGEDLKRLQSLLKEFIEASNTGWSFAKIDELFKPEQKQLSDLIFQFTEERKTLKSQRLAKEAELDRWISNLS